MSRASASGISQATGFGSQAAHVEGLLAQLTARRARLRRLGRLLGRMAVLLIAAGLIIGIPDPGGGALFGMSPQGRYATIPPELALDLRGKGEAIKLYPDQWDKLGASGTSIWGIALALLLVARVTIAPLIPLEAVRLKQFVAWTVMVPLALMVGAGAKDPVSAAVVLCLIGLGGYLAMRRIMSEMAGRITAVCVLPALIFIATHLIHSALNGYTFKEDSVYAAHAGTISDKPDAMPASMDTAEAASARHMTQTLGPDGRAVWHNVPEDYVSPYHLRPEFYGVLLADQARYVLAQQAYFQNDDRSTAKHLRALAGAWRPSEWHVRARIGALAEWSKLHGSDPGAVSRDIADGAPFFWERHYAGGCLKYLGYVLGTLALGLVLLANRLGNKADRFRRGFATATSSVNMGA